MRTVAIALASTIFALSAIAVGHPGHDAGHDEGHEAAPGTSSGDLAFKGTPLRAHLFWVEGPFASKPSKLRVEWYDKNNASTDPAAAFGVSFFMPMPNMPGGGHGSKPRQAIRIAVGVYEVQDIDFLDMAGPWEVRATLRYPSGETETAVWKIIVPESESAALLFDRGLESRQLQALFEQRFD
jgi:hypothetical protein